MTLTVERTNRIIEFLDRRIAHSCGNIDPERAVREYGRTFIGIDRPKGFRQRKKKACFLNSGLLASYDRGIYVEGFALSPEMPPFHHAWITLDLVHAIDVTLRDAPYYSYFGIPFPTKIVRHAMIKRGYFDMLEYPTDWQLIGLEPIAGLSPDEQRTRRAHYKRPTGATFQWS